MNSLSDDPPVDNLDDSPDFDAWVEALENDFGTSDFGPNDPDN